MTGDYLSNTLHKILLLMEQWKHEWRESLKPGSHYITKHDLLETEKRIMEAKLSNAIVIIGKTIKPGEAAGFTCVVAAVLDGKSKNSIEEKLSNARFGYSLKKVGIKQKTNTSWSLTYQRTILGTNETFKIECALVNDTCKVYMDEKAWNTIFN